jgi:hypothetical protein
MQIQLDELQVECPKCEGIGELENDKPRANNSFGPSGPRQIMRQTCPVCSGKRVVPTEAGRVLLQFLSNFQR